MFGIGIPELVVIAVVALIVVGPKNLPVTLRAVGRAIREFQRASKELRREAGFDEVVEEVTRPLREGLSGIEADVLREDPDHSLEYPASGPDDYGALPEYAAVYRDLPAYSPPAHLARPRPVEPADGDGDGDAPRGKVDPSLEPPEEPAPGKVDASLEAAPDDTTPERDAHG